MKKLTINEIAEMVGVSKTTISFYLNGKTNKMSDETQKKIQQVIEETGYTPSAATRTVKASDDCIGVILGDVSKPFAAKALKGIEEEAHEAGYQVIVGSNEMSFAKEKEYVEHMLKMGVSGFIIQATYRFGILAMELEKKNKKVVYLDIPPYDSQGVRILGDNYQCVYDAISQCIERGYDQLLVVSDANESEYTGMDNLRGFKDAANDAGVSFKTCFIEAETTREEIHDYLEQYISEYKKTLVYASDVEALRKVYLGIKLFPDFQSLFPERLGLIGFDVTGWTKIAVPEISAIMIPAYQEGQIASRKLIEMIESKNSISNKKVIIKNAVRWRDSTL